MQIAHVTVEERNWHSCITYVPICPVAKMLAKIANQKNLSLRMINILKENGVRVIEKASKGS